MWRGFMWRFGFAAVTAVVVGGCVVPGAMGQGAAPEAIARSLILQADAAIDSTCSSREFGSKERLPADDAGRYQDVTRERWNLTRCGKTVPYLVTFTREHVNPGQYRTHVRVRPENESIPELAYIKNLAERNQCRLTGDPRVTIKTGSTHRLYEVPCEGGSMNFECGQTLQGHSGESCWRM